MHVAHVVLEAVDGIHHAEVGAGAVDVMRLDDDRQHVDADREAAHDGFDVLVVAGVIVQLGDALAEVAGLHVARLHGRTGHEHGSHHQHHQRGARLREHLDAAPQPLATRLSTGDPQLFDFRRLQVQIGEQDGEQHLVGDDHDRDAQAGGDRQLTHHGDGDVDHDHEADGIGQQCHGTGHEQLAE